MRLKPRFDHYDMIKNIDDITRPVYNKCYHDRFIRYHHRFIMIAFSWLAIELLLLLASLYSLLVMPLDVGTDLNGLLYG